MWPTCLDPGIVLQDRFVLDRTGYIRTAYRAVFTIFAIYGTHFAAILFNSNQLKPQMIMVSAAPIG
jgi:hypothetical protein